MSDVIRCECWICERSRQQERLAVQEAWQKYEAELDTQLAEMREEAGRRISNMVDEAWEKNGERR